MPKRKWSGKAAGDSWTTAGGSHCVRTRRGKRCFNAASAAGARRASVCYKAGKGYIKSHMATSRKGRKYRVKAHCIRSRKRKA